MRTPRMENVMVELIFGIQRGLDSDFRSEGGITRFVLASPVFVTGSVRYSFPSIANPVPQ